MLPLTCGGMILVTGYTNVIDGTKPSDLDNIFFFSFLTLQGKSSRWGEVGVPG